MQIERFINTNNIIIIKMVDKKDVIAKVFLNKTSDQKLITIPKDCDIEAGDYVKIIKMKVIENGKNK